MVYVTRTVCWKYLDSISESRSPHEFLEFCEVIRRKAVSLGFTYSSSDSFLTEELARNKMIEAIGRTLQWKPSTLPSIGNTIMINGESWQVMLNLTSIPHLRAAVVDRGSNVDLGGAYRFHLVRQLVNDGNVDYGFDDSNRLYGRTWELYLFCKIRLIKKLREAYTKLPFQNRVPLQPPDRVFPQLRGKLSRMSSFNDVRAEVQEFLDACDKVLVDDVGKDELVRYLQGWIDPTQLLHAQKSLLVRVLF